MITKTQSLKKQFFNSIQCGTGRAYLIAQENPSIDFSAYIIKGALNNYAYDGQCESSRAQYIFGLIMLSDQKDKIRKAVLEGLFAENEDTWSLTHLFDLVKLYAEQGDEEARNAIYQRFLQGDSDWVGYEEILALDGLKGLLFIAEKFGKELEQDPDRWQDSSIVNHFQRENPSISAMTELEAAAKVNRHIRIYLDEIKEKEAEYNQEKESPEPTTFANIVDEILDDSLPNSWVKRRIRLLKLNEDEVYAIGAQLMKEKDKTNIERLLQAFFWHPFPFDSNFMLKLAKRRKNPQNEIREYAIDALRFLKSEDIRAFALERIPKTRDPATFTNILISNYQSGDHKLLSHIANKFNDEHIIEDLTISYSKIYTKNETAECKEPFEALYEKMNCGIHRYGVVKTLMDYGVLSDEIKREIKYDSYDDTRALA